MNIKEIRDWTKKEFEEINELIKDRPFLSHYDFLRIRNFKINSFSIENEGHIKEITEKAFKFANEDKIKEAINELVKLHGIAIPIASAILAMKFPDKFAIIDKRVLEQLGKEDWLKDYLKNPETYEKYILFMRETKPKEGSLRDYERSLFEKELKKGDI